MVDISLEGRLQEFSDLRTRFVRSEAKMRPGPVEVQDGPDEVLNGSLQDQFIQVSKKGVQKGP